uniref:DRMBL domain-containing protein n=1 Tax=Toxocara canis TaxID=6265 RepID=A0A183ULQ6_TOXCA
LIRPICFQFFHSFCIKKAAIDCLQNTWSRAQIYCTRETAQILPVLTARAPQLNGIDKRWLTVLEVNVCHKMDGFWVTPLEANHVPGAVMYLFEGPAIKSGPVLCTGDFRADTKFYAQKSTILLLQQHLFKTIYLDNTYLKSAIQEFPSYEESLQEVVNVISEIPKESKIYFITNRVGREQFLVDLSRKIQERIGLDSGRWAVAEVLGLSKHFTAKGENTRIRTCRRRDARKVLKDEGTFVIELTMLGHLKPNAITQHARARAVDYSDHCSPNELRDFLSLLKFRQLVGCAEPLSAARLNELRSLTLLAENGQASSAGANENDAGSDLRSDLELVASEVNTESSTIKRYVLS